jgi:hypothetical protein
MSDEWIDLNDIEDVARAKVEGWEIESRSHETSEWRKWNGTYWGAGYLFRGRPKQPQEVIYECYDVDGRLEWWHPKRNVAKPWPRHPELDKTIKVPK